MVTETVQWSIARWNWYFAKQNILQSTNWLWELVLPAMKYVVLFHKVPY